MAEINKTQPLSPVLPTSTETGIRRGQPRPEQQKDKKQQQRQRPQPDEGHQLDEYA